MMMNEIEKFMSDLGGSINYKIINLGGKMVYIEGIKSVISLDETQMDFQLNRTMLSIVGRGLQIKYLDKTTCTIKGEINSVLTK